MKVSYRGSQRWLHIKELIGNIMAVNAGDILRLVSMVMGLLWGRSADGEGSANNYQYAEENPQEK